MDDNLFSLDYVSPTAFDNGYFQNLMSYKGLLNSDQVLFMESKDSLVLVKKYAESKYAFFSQFADSMMRMGNISPQTGSKGETRKSCRKRN
ncbi:hypothetical protein CDL15_Pgr004079 [Punica granatum]|uniref:peroxidase n=1 Tax=Punica granatum TaxID=22663 RepID=A0A218XFX2_PUNGR|nr:hypothetical protein CDL15_Pgr004079 [Punica granatum]PKI36888.1 hypothetical protein CRG98_042730 [Punica granatum]